MFYFLLYLFLEVLVSVSISSEIGGFATFFEILLSAFIGISILVNFRATLMENIRAVSLNAIDLEEFQRLNIFTLIGAILLILPGFLTDIIGALLQFSVFTRMMVNHYGVKFNKNCKSSYNEKINKQKDSDVIDVEIIGDGSIIK